MRVGVAQVYPRLLDLDYNLGLHLRYIQKAKDRGVDLLVFPELSLTGYSLGWMVPRVALKTRSDLLARIAESADDLVVVMGAVLEEDGLFYNSALVFHEGGLDVHHKVYLPTYGMFDEMRFFSRGKDFKLIETHLGKLALNICEDAWHMESYTTRTQADLFILIANNPFRMVRGRTSVEVWRYIAKIPPVFFGTPSVYANRVGVEDGITFFGSSMVLGPDGEVLSEGPFLEEDFIIAEINPIEVRAARFHSATLREDYAFWKSTR